MIRYRRTILVFIKIGIYNDTEEEIQGNRIESQSHNTEETPNGRAENKEHKVMITNMKLFSKTQLAGKQQQLQLMNLRTKNECHGKEKSTEFVIKKKSCRHGMTGEKCIYLHPAPC